MIRRLLLVALAGLALAGPAQAVDWREVYQGYAPDRAPRLCAQRMVERQVAYMQLRGWPVVMPEVRTWAVGDVAGGSPFPYQGRVASALGATLPWEGRWVLLLSPGTEAGLCLNNRSLTPATAWRWDDDAMETGFHELLHQIWNEGEDHGHSLVEPRAAAMVVNYRRSIERSAGLRLASRPDRPIPRFSPQRQGRLVTG